MINLAYCCRRFDLFKGHNSTLAGYQTLPKSMSVKNLGKYGDDPMNNIQV